MYIHMDKLLFFLYREKGFIYVDIYIYILVYMHGWDGAF